MLSLAASRSKKPSAQLPDPNIRLGFGETAAQGGLSLSGAAELQRRMSSLMAPSHRLARRKQMSAFGREVEVANTVRNDTSDPSPSSVAKSCCDAQRSLDRPADPRFVAQRNKNPSASYRPKPLTSDVATFNVS